MMKAIISGIIDGNTIISKRTSGTCDIIPIDVTLQDSLQCKLIGEFKSENTPDRHVKLYFHVEKIEPYVAPDENYIEFDGFVCKSPNTRVTPLGRTITDLLIAVNNNPFESDYVPCVAWTALATVHIGDQVHIVGRMQSRTYHESKTAYEISIQKINAK